MSTVFFPSCKATAKFKEESKQLAEYVRKKNEIDPIGCCRKHHKDLEVEDTALVVCNNCAAIIEESSKTKNIEFVWQMIDNDPQFDFPNYHGEEITIQDCWIAYEKRHVQDAVRSLLRKMNFTIVELEENYEKTLFCGVNLLSPCTKSNAELAKKRYVEEGAHMFTPCSADEQKARFQKHCAKIQTEKVACYCTFCTEAICLGGKQGKHMLELLFG